MRFCRFAPLRSPRALFGAPAAADAIAVVAVAAVTAVAAVAVLAGVAAHPASASDFPATTQWVLTSAKIPNTFPAPQYVTSLRIVNPSSKEANVDLTYLSQSPLDGSYTATGDNGSSLPVRVKVGANQTLAIEDVVTTTFGDPAPFGVHAGGIRAVSDVAVSVFSRTYVSNAQSSSGVPGTFGISIPAVDSDLAVSAGDTAYLPYGAANPDTTKGFRSNLLLLNTASSISVAHVKVVKGDGTTVGERDYTLARLAQTQQNRLPDSFGYTGPDENLTVVVTVTSGGPVAVGLTPVDNAISSQNFTGPSKVFAPNNGAFGLILDDGGYGFSGRLDILDGQADFLSAGIVLTSCPTGVALYFFQAFGSGANKNSDFTRNANGSWSFKGGRADGTARWSGDVYPEVDGTVYGSITYERTSSAKDCPGTGTTYSFEGARASRFSSGS